MPEIIVIKENAAANPKTAAMADAFIQSAERNGMTADVYDTADLKLYGCRACECCFKTGKPCAFNDDFNKIAVKIAEADGLVYAFPVKFFTIPSKTKAFMDKFFSFYVTGRNFLGKKGALISTCEGSDLTEFTAIKYMFEKSMKTLKMENAGEVLASGLGSDDMKPLLRGIADAAMLADRF